MRRACADGRRQASASCERAPSVTAPDAARAQFFAGYLLEQSLSVDNLFVFILIFTYFQTPRLDQDKVRQRRGRHASAPIYMNRSLT